MFMKNFAVGRYISNSTVDSLMKPVGLMVAVLGYGLISKRKEVIDTHIKQPPPLFYGGYPLASQDLDFSLLSISFKASRNESPAVLTFASTSLGSSFASSR